MGNDINGQDIINGIVSALSKEFGEKYTYYINDIPQGFNEPAFYVRLLNSDFNLVCQNRYLRKNLFIIRYFPESELNPQQEINSILDRLYPVLEYIYMGKDLIRGTNTEVEIIDNILHLKIHYDLFVIRPINRGPLMQKLIQNQKVK